MKISTATTAELLAFFNANTGGAQVKKFADRKTAERRCQVLIDEMIEEGDAEGYDLSGTTSDAQDANPCESSLMRYDGHTICPHCGIDLRNGVGEHNQEVNGKRIKHDYFQFECLACGGEFGPGIPSRYVRPSGAPITSRPAMVATMKIDRQIVSVHSGIVYKNACQVWKAGLVSASQGDRLSAVLYGAAKQGNRLMSLTLNGHLFALAVK